MVLSKFDCQISDIIRVGSDSIQACNMIAFRDICFGWPDSSRMWIPCEIDDGLPRNIEKAHSFIKRATIDLKANVENDLILWHCHCLHGWDAIGFFCLEPRRLLTVWESQRDSCKPTSSCVNLGVDGRKLAERLNRIKGLVELCKIREGGYRREAHLPRKIRRYLCPKKKREFLEEIRAIWSITLQSDNCLIIRYFLYKTPFTISSPFFLFYQPLTLIVEPDSTVPFSRQNFHCNKLNFWKIVANANVCRSCGLSFLCIEQCWRLTILEVKLKARQEPRPVVVAKSRESVLVVNVSELTILRPHLLSWRELNSLYSGIWAGRTGLS